MRTCPVAALPAVFSTAAPAQAFSETDGTPTFELFYGYDPVKGK